MGLRDLLFGNKPTTYSGWSPLTDAHKARQQLFGLYWSYYRGRHRKSLKVRPGEPDDNVTLNYSKRVVNKGIQFLFGMPVGFEIDATDSERSPEEEYLDQVWGIDEVKMPFLQQVAQNGGVTGMAVLRLYEPNPNIPDSLPRVVNIDPSLLEIVTNPDDINDIYGYQLIWQVGKVWKRHRIDVQADSTWYVTAETTGQGTTQWQELPDESAPWPYPFPPLITAQNLPLANELWGMSDLEEADINDAINFTASNTGRIIRFHAHPKTIGTGFSSSQVQSTAIDEMWAIPVDNAKVANLEMQSDLASSRAFLQDLKTAYAKTTSVPDLDPAQVNVGALSGFALRILYGDLLDITHIKQKTYGEMLIEANKRILAIGGKGEYGTIQPTNAWQDPLPSSGLEEAQALQIDRQNGLSMETYLTKRGYDAEQEAERRGQEQQEQQTTLAAAMVDAQRNFDQGGNNNFGGDNGGTPGN